MVDLSKYTITIGCDDNDNYIGLCAEYPNIRIEEDSYKACHAWLVNAIELEQCAINGTTQEEYK
jgi:hypothetical protein